MKDDKPERQPCSLFLPEIFLPLSPSDASPANHHQYPAPRCVKEVGKDANAISRKRAPLDAGARRALCPNEHRPLHKSLACPSSASRCKPRFHLMGALQTSEGARLPRIGASCARSDSSLSERKTPWNTRRESRGSHAPLDYMMGHKRSRRRSHPNADDLRPVDSRISRQPSVASPT